MDSRGVTCQAQEASLATGGDRGCRKSPALQPNRAGDCMNNKLRERQQKTCLSPKPGETAISINDTGQGLRSGLVTTQMKRYRNSESG